MPKWRNHKDFEEMDTFVRTEISDAKGINWYSCMQQRYNVLQSKIDNGYDEVWYYFCLFCGLSFAQCSNWIKLLMLVPQGFNLLYEPIVYQDLCCRNDILLYSQHLTLFSKWYFNVLSKCKIKKKIFLLSFFFLNVSLIPHHSFRNLRFV